MHQQRIMLVATLNLTESLDVAQHVVGGCVECMQQDATPGLSHYVTTLKWALQMLADPAGSP